MPPCPAAILHKRVVSLCQLDDSQCVFPMKAVDVPSYFAKSVPTRVACVAPRGKVLAGSAAVSTHMSYEKDAVNEARRSCEASGSIARVATRGCPYEAPLMTSTLRLESDAHSLVSQEDPPYRAVGEYSARPKFRPKVVTENDPLARSFAGNIALKVCAS